MECIPLKKGNPKWNNFTGLIEASGGATNLKYRQHTGKIGKNMDRTFLVAFNIESYNITSSNLGKYI